MLSSQNIPKNKMISTSKIICGGLSQIHLDNLGLAQPCLQVLTPRHGRWLISLCGMRTAVLELYFNFVTFFLLKKESKRDVVQWHARFSPSFATPAGLQYSGFYLRVAPLLSNIFYFIYNKAPCLSFYPKKEEKKTFEPYKQLNIYSKKKIKVFLSKRKRRRRKRKVCIPAPAALNVFPEWPRVRVASSFLRCFAFSFLRFIPPPGFSFRAASRRRQGERPPLARSSSGDSTPTSIREVCPPIPFPFLPAARNRTPKPRCMLSVLGSDHVFYLINFDVFAKIIAHVLYWVRPCWPLG